MQIDLEPHEHSTLIEVVKTPKWMFFSILAGWFALVAGFAFVLDYGWPVVALAGTGVVIGVGWVTTYPEYHMRRLKD